MNYKQIKAIEQVNKGQILKICPNAPEESGIYIFTREENGFKHAYVGQAKHLLSRMAQHLSGYQCIDWSIKKHGLYDDVKNPNGWKVRFMTFDTQYLDEMEQRYIKQYANAGYQLKNRTSGSQGKGKVNIADKPRKGYQQGINTGYEKARKEIKRMFELHLMYDVKKQGNKTQQKAKEKFEQFIEKEINNEDIRIK